MSVALAPAASFRHAAAAVVLAVSLAFASGAQAQDADAGRRAIERFGCVSCHAIPGVAQRSDGGCVGCHQNIRRRAAARFSPGPEVEHLLVTPDLAHVTRRLGEAYLVRYLMDPHDVRHRLEESMPRLPVGEIEARDIVAYLRREGGTYVAPASPAPDRSRLARGERVFATGACSGCHAFGNIEPGFEFPALALAGLGDAATLAPNLRYARERMDPDTMLAWIIDPAAVSPSAHMQRPEIPAADALAVRDYILLADLGRAVRPPVAPTIADITPLSRRVSFREVRALFGQSCIHCHSHASGDGASAALGFDAFELDLSSWEGVQAGVVNVSGEGHSILEPGPDGLPPLIARLLTRHLEARRDIVTPLRDPLEPGLRRSRDEEPVGMPLGLPPLSRSAIRVIATWLAQGAPR